MAGFGAGFDNHATVWLTLEEQPEAPRGDLLLEQYLPVTASSTKL